ncbi:sec-independent translocase [Corynebacterium auriscanis]|nr:sec-independent translocase [Corynebacterium auriscanis]
MFSSVGWVELAIIFVVALLVIGPERLPGLIKELRAIMLAIRNAVGEARQQLDGEFGEEIREFSKPLAELNSVRQMGARGFITKTLFDGDESYLTSLDDTKNQFRDTVETIRQPNLRDTLRGAGAGTNASASGQQGTAAQGGVEITQQATAGESREQVRTGGESPVQQAADHLAMEARAGGAGPGIAGNIGGDHSAGAQSRGEQGAGVQTNAAQATGSAQTAGSAVPVSENTKSQPPQAATGGGQTANASGWDDVI